MKGYYTTKVLFLAILLTLGYNIGNTQSVEYDELTLQEQADLSRWLGWVWGDGRPLDQDNLTGIEFAGANNNPYRSRYEDLTDRLRASPLGIVIDGANRKEILGPWDYWCNSLPGGNPGDPQLLRDAVKNPNFLAGIIDGEGGGCGNTNNNYFIDDHTFSPFHTDTGREWGLLNFGPYRMVELFHLLGDTYGFEKTTMQLYNRERIKYSDELERESVITDLINIYNDIYEHNLDVLANGGESRGVGVKIYIDKDDWDTFRSYGYWSSPKRYPDCNDVLASNSGSFPLINLPLAECEEVVEMDPCIIVSDSDLVADNGTWNLVTPGTGDATFSVTNGLAEIDINDSGTLSWHVSLRHENVELQEGTSYWISYDAYAEEDRSMNIILNSSNSSNGYFFTVQEITTTPTTYTHEFTMNDPDDLNAFMRINVGNQQAHKVFLENIRLVEAECVCPEQRVFDKNINDATAHFESSEHIFGSNAIEGTSSIIYDAGVFVELNADFEVKTGSIFHAFIDGCGSQ